MRRAPRSSSPMPPHSRRPLGARAPACRAWVAAGVLAAIATPGHAQNAPSFQGLGDLGGGAADSQAAGVSADGEVVVGVSESGLGTEAFRWTPSGGMQGLGSLSSGNFSSTAAAVSADGSVVVGTSASASDASRAFRWSLSSGQMTALDNFGCLLCTLDLATGHGVSPDGQTVVGAGTRNPFLQTPYEEAARWTGGGTAIDGIGLVPNGDTASFANDVSAGGIVVGGGGDASGDTVAFWWDGTLHVLPALVVDEPMSEATAITPDGAVIVGAANTGALGAGVSTAEPVRWLDAAGAFDQVEHLGRLPGVDVPGGTALAVTPDGSLIVGRTRDASGANVAFLWDPAGGLRALREELEEEYGLDLAGWTLLEATGVSDPDAAGEVVVVGSGLNPSGEPEAWRARLSAPECNDGQDNDGDGQTDFGADPECLAKGDRSEGPDCSDALDNDDDGDADFPADEGCRTAADLSEGPDCSDGVDNDGDGLADFPADPGCRDAAGAQEDPVCDDGVDNDGDGATDFPADPACLGGDDLSETLDCQDGLDNDGDGLVDLADPQCEAGGDPSEDPECRDRLDNDGDGREDYPAAYPACISADDPSERPQCSDGEDNDGDGQSDFGADPGCAAEDALTESPVALAPGDLLAVSRVGRRVFRVDPATGVQTELSRGAFLSEPQGLAQRSGGELVVADPAGLVELDPATGAQRLASPPLVPFQSLQVVFDPAGDPILLEDGAFTRVPWQLGGIPAKSTLLAVPSGILLNLAGDAMVLEAGGDLLFSGFSVTGGRGVHRLDLGTGVAAPLVPVFGDDRWRDLGLEADGQIVSVGDDFPAMPGVSRIDPVSGLDSVVSSGAGWVQPEGVAVGADGTLYVSDAGSCDPGWSCTGSELVVVDPGSGARTAVWSGGFIDGPLDLLVVGARTACANGSDDDGDGQADYPADDGCRSPGDVSERPECDDGLDNDGDGSIDLADPGCPDTDAGSVEDPSTQCTDELDNDGDGRVDFDGGLAGTEPDPQCVGKPYRNKEKKCGLGPEAALALLLLPLVRRRRP